MPSRVSRLGILLLVCIAIGPSPASAHASLIRSDPADRSSVAVSPSKVTLTFNEDMSHPAYVAVRAPDGSKVQVAEVTVSGSRVVARLASSDQRGRYRATYRVVSNDAHPVEGSIFWTTTTGTTVKQVEPNGEGFIERNRSHFFWGILAAAVAIALLLAPLRGRDDTNDS